VFQLARLLFGGHMSVTSQVQERANIGALLIKAGASINVRNKKGRTPLQSCTDDRLRNALQNFAAKQ